MFAQYGNSVFEGFSGFKNLKSINILQLQRLLLSGQHVVALFQSHTLARVLVVRGEASRVCRFCDFTSAGFFGKSVDTLSISVQSVHQMHCGEKKV